MSVRNVFATEERFNTFERIEANGLRLPIVLNYILSFSVGAALHDARVVLFLLLTLLNNLIVELLQHIIKRPRPEPYTSFGQPAKEVEQIVFLTVFYFVNSIWDKPRRSIASMLGLVAAVTWTMLSVILGQHYFDEQVVGGVFVALVNGTAGGILVNKLFLPLMYTHYAWWCHNAPVFLQYSLGGPTYVARDPMGTNNLFFTILRFFIVNLFHF